MSIKISFQCLVTISRNEIPDREIINLQDNNGLTFLHHLIQNNNLDGIRRLCAADTGINLNLKDERGDSIVHYAVKYAKDTNNYDILNFLTDSTYGFSFRKS